jgi:hypothetical protein
MRNAPSVVFPVGRSAFYGRVLVFLGALALLVLGGWGLSQRSVPDLLPVGFTGILMWVLWAAWAWRGWRLSPVGLLQWDANASPVDEPLRAGAWRWTSAVSGDGVLLLAVERALDLQSRVLLRLRCADRSGLWVWVERSGDPLRWNDLRRALAGAGT